MSRNALVARATLIVMVGFLMSKVAGIVRQLAIARVFGTSGELDAYFAAFTAPDLIFMLISGGALATAFIPIFSEYLNQKDESRAEAWQMASNVLTVSVLLSRAGGAAGGLRGPLDRDAAGSARLRARQPGADRRPDAAYPRVHNHLQLERAGDGRAAHPSALSAARLRPALLQPWHHRGGAAHRAPLARRAAGPRAGLGLDHRGGAAPGHPGSRADLPSRAAAPPSWT